MRLAEFFNLDEFTQIQEKITQITNSSMFSSNFFKISFSRDLITQMSLIDITGLGIILILLDKMAWFKSSEHFYIFKDIIN